MSGNECGRIRGLIENILAGHGAAAATRKTIRRHLDDCPSCRRYEYARRSALEKQIKFWLNSREIESAKDKLSGRLLEVRAESLIDKIRNRQEIHIRELMWLCRACERMESLVLRACAVEQIAACSLQKPSYCPAISPVLAKVGRGRLTEKEGNQIVQHFRDCGKCWTIHKFEQLLTETRPLVDELKQERGEGSCSEWEGALLKEKRAGLSSLERAEFEKHRRSCPHCRSFFETDKALDELKRLLVVTATAARIASRIPGPETDDPQARGKTEPTPDSPPGEKQTPRNDFAAQGHTVSSGSEGHRGESSPGYAAPREPRLVPGENDSASLPFAESREELATAMLQIVLRRIKKGQTISIVELKWLLSFLLLVPPEERDRPFSMLHDCRIEGGEFCEGIEVLLNRWDEDALTREEEAYIELHLRQCDKCWALWQYKQLVGHVPCREEQAFADEQCGHMQEIILSVFDGAAVSAEETKRLSLHLDQCAPCRKFEAYYRQLQETLSRRRQNKPPFLQAEERRPPRYAEAARKLLREISGKRSLTIRELGWLSFMVGNIEDPEERALLASQLKDCKSRNAHYCVGIADLVRKKDKRRLTPLERARLQDHLGECGHCWSLFALERLLIRTAADSPRPAVPWLRHAFRSKRGYRIVGSTVTAAAVIVIVMLLVFSPPKTTGDMVDALLKQAESLDLRIAHQAIQELGRFLEPRVVYALGRELINKPADSLTGVRVVALLQIGTPKALDFIKRWERLPTSQRRIEFPRLWDEYPRRDRERILNSLVEHGSAELVVNFIDSALEREESRVASFCKEVFEKRTEPELQYSALVTLEHFNTTAGLDLKSLIERIEVTKTTIAAAVIRLSAAVGEFSQTQTILRYFHKQTDSWSARNMSALSACFLYLIQATDCRKWIPSLKEAFASAKGSKKTTLAAVLAAKNVPSAVSYLKERLREGEQTERIAICNYLIAGPIDGFVPYLQELIESPPPVFSEKDLDALKQTVRILREHSR